MPEKTDMTEQRPKRRYIVFVSGPAGCGKTTVSQHVADTFGFKFVEGDSLHPKANIDKMSANIPLTDVDRAPWLRKIRRLSVQMLREDPKLQGVVISCSALKKKYRDLLRGLNPDEAEDKSEEDRENISQLFLFLSVPKDELVTRLLNRKNHYMKESMLLSQLADLELPETKVDEKDAFVINVSGKPQDQVNSLVDEFLHKHLS